MVEIIPAIMPTNEKDLTEKLALLGDFSGVIQLDLMDGVFVPEKTWMPNKLPVGPPATLRVAMRAGNFELDLMIKNAATRMDEWLALKPKRLIFHLEAENPDFLTSLIRENKRIVGGVEIGLAINITTPIEKLESFITQIDFAQCMGIEKIGYQGQPFDERVIARVAELRGRYPDLPISVDGGVNLENAPRLLASGVARLAVGSAIWQSPAPVETLKKFQNLI